MKVVDASQESILKSSLKDEIYIRVVRGQFNRLFQRLLGR